MCRTRVSSENNFVGRYFKLEKRAMDDNRRLNRSISLTRRLVYCRALLSALRSSSRLCTSACIAESGFLSSWMICEITCARLASASHFHHVHGKTLYLHLPQHHD